MQNLIPHPTSTHTAYFWRTPLPQKQEIPEKTWWWHDHHVCSGIYYFWGSWDRKMYVECILVGCGIKFRIQRLPTQNTFDRPCYPKNRKYLKNIMMTSSSCFFRYFLFFGYWGSSKVCRVGTRWMRNQIPHPTSSPNRNLSKNTMRYVKNMNEK